MRKLQMVSATAVKKMIKEEINDVIYNESNKNFKKALISIREFLIANVNDLKEI